MLHAHLSLDRAAHEHEAAGRAGDRTLDQQQAALGVALDDLEVERGDARVAHLAGHLHALEHARRRGAGADRAGRTVLLVVTVRRALAGEVVTLHHAGETAALADAGHVDPLAGGEHVGGDDLPELEAREIVDAQLGEVALRRTARGLEVTELRFVEPRGLGLAERDLHGGVAVALRRPELHDATGPGFDDAHRDDPVLVVEDLGHAELSAQNPFLRHRSPLMRVSAEKFDSGVSTHANAPHGPSPAERELGCAARFPDGLGPARASVDFADGPRLGGVTRGPRDRGPQSPVMLAPRPVWALAVSEDAGQ